MTAEAPAPKPMTDDELTEARKIASGYWSPAKVSLCERVNIKAAKILGIANQQITAAESCRRLNLLAAAFNAVDAELTALKAKP